MPLISFTNPPGSTHTGTGFELIFVNQRMSAFEHLFCDVNGCREQIHSSSRYTLSIGEN